MPEHGGASVTIRTAVEDDVPTLLRLIYGLAAYEGRADSCVVTELALRNALFGPHPLTQAILAEDAGETVGYALVSWYFSPVPGVPGLFMEHLYVVAERRGRGVGRALIQHVARTAVEQGADRMEWGVLKTNKPGIGFYTRLGAELVDDFMTCRLEGDALRRIAGTE